MTFSLQQASAPAIRAAFYCGLLLTLFCGAASGAPKATIQGGKGVGSFELGQKWAPYSKALGTATKEQKSELSTDARLIYFKNYGMYFFVKKDLVNGITVESPLFVTPEGLHVGSEMNQVLQTYGNPQSLRADNVVYPERGLGFTFTSGRVARIYIMDKENRDLASGDRRIVPGMRVGGLQLGQGTSFVVKQWKDPEKKQTLPNKKGAELWSYSKRGIVLIVSQGHIEGVWISSGEFRSIKDIHVGSKRESVVAAYGPPRSKDKEIESYPDNGIEFFYDKGVVKQIFVKESGK